MKYLQKLEEERQVYSYADWKGAMEDDAGMCVKTRWVLTENGEDVRCRFVAEEFAKGPPRELLLVGTPSLFVARLLLSPTACCDHACAASWLLTSLAHSSMEGSRELVQRASVGGRGEWAGAMLGNFVRAVYNTRDTLQ